ISATHRDFDGAVAERAFRLDLFHRLDDFHLVVPPLRERPEDILDLTGQFMTVTARRLGRRLESISAEAKEALQSYAFPGNVRELRNVVERGVILEKTNELTLRSIVLGRGMPASEAQGEAFLRVDAREDGELPSLREVERDYVARVLEHTGWN